jgi:hypothetical protein
MYTIIRTINDNSSILLWTNTKLNILWGIRSDIALWCRKTKQEPLFLIYIFFYFNNIFLLVSLMDQNKIFLYQWLEQINWLHFFFLINLYFSDSITTKNCLSYVYYESEHKYGDIYLGKCTYFKIRATFNIFK